MTDRALLSGRFLVKFGPRIKRVEVNCDVVCFKTSLELSIRNAMLSDPVMKGHAESPLFLVQQDPKTGLDIEIDSNTQFWEVDSDLPITLMLHSTTNLDIPLRQNKEQNARASGSSSIPEQSSVPHSVATYLDSVGVSVHSVPVQAAAQTSSNISGEMEQQILSTPPASNRKKKSLPESPVGEYLEHVLQTREENRRRLETLVPTKAPKLRTATKRKKQKGKENIERRTMPRRAAKEAAQAAIAEPGQDDEGSTVNEIATEEVESVAQGPISTKQLKAVETKVVGNFHKKKNHRQIGTVITKFTPLPEFLKTLIASLKKGTYDTKQMNAFLKDHVKTVTGDSKISRGEYTILADQVTNRFKSMNIVYPDGYWKKIKKDLSNSLRNERYYPKKKEERAVKRYEKSNEPDVEEIIEEDGLEGEGHKDEADIILQKPVVNRQSVKMCISASTTRIAYIKSHSVEEVVAKYPYLKEADLLIYEYSSRIPMPLNTLRENFTTIIPALSHILNVLLPTDDDEQGKIFLYKKIEDFYVREEGHLPSIQFCDAANKNAVPLNNIPKGQAPALVILKDDSKILRSANLIFDGAILTTLIRPSAFDSLALLLAAYWVFHIDYPAPYKQHLESFEAILHGNVLSTNVKTRYSKMNEFFRKLSIAVKSSH